MTTMTTMTIRRIGHLTGLQSKLILPQQRQVCISNFLPDEEKQQQQQWTDDQQYKPDHLDRLSRLVKRRLA